MYNHILSIVLFTPLVGALVLLLIPKEQKNAIRWVANMFSLAGLLISIPLIPWFWVLRTQPGFKFIEGAKPAPPYNPETGGSRPSLPVRKVRGSSRKVSIDFESGCQALRLRRPAIPYSLLRDQKVDESYAVAGSALSAQPHSAPLLAAMGNVQFGAPKCRKARPLHQRAGRRSEGGPCLWFPARSIWPIVVSLDRRHLELRS